MRVVLTVNAAWNALNFRRPVIEALLNQGHHVTILSPHDATVSALRAMGCQVVDLQMDVQGMSPRRDAKLAGCLAAHFATLRPDVILSYTVKNNIFGAVAAKRLGIPFLPNVSGLGTGFLSSGALRMVVETLYRFAFRGLPILFFQNPDDRDLFIQRRLIAPVQARLLPGSGVDLDQFSPRLHPPDSGTVFLMISRLLRDKGVLEFVDAARQIKSMRDDVHFQILGSIGAANRSALGPALLNGWIKEGVIDHLGEHDDVRPFIAQADCVVLPSYREGAPRTLLEAASMARPLIATDVPGCRHVVDNGITGLLCAPRDAEDLRHTMEIFADLPTNTRMMMGGAGREKMLREYDQKIVVDRYLSAIADLVPDLSTATDTRLSA
ncbi:glycosyltransferase family 4 protein [Aliiroseovarius sp. F47248L]|uniref:glycosyltransferase family 4 protein n=1 Tax=Aliiroseovarius sp. F47248L TaxID=2926420 RepID=UPI001FF39792|nr:glycosyltransferase family 4 protein [Aliiroseovarius sp. F47248L]MCK0139997.1 glycosyltransferase family 4 protein [Aliiroseovarius sp. F47248L]